MKKELKYSYLSLTLEKFEIFEENLSIQNKEMQIKTEVRFDYKDKEIIVSQIEVMYCQNDKPVLNAIMTSSFLIDKDSIKKLTEQKTLTFDVPILIQFASLNYGALRGAISQRTLGTSLKNYILPPIYFDKIIQKPFIIELEPTV